MPLPADALSSLVLALGLVLISLPVTAQPIEVPEDYSTIQEGLNAAREGDTVLVQPGTYEEDISWPKTIRIKLMSAVNASNTIIDGGEQGHVFYITGIDTTTLIEGFTVTGGGGDQSDGVYYLEGGGFYIKGASPTLKNVRITGNTAYQGGGGYITYGSPKLVDVVIEDNIADRSGGGLHLWSSNLTSNENLRILNNRALRGGGVKASLSNVSDMIIARNVAEGSCGGLFDDAGAEGDAGGTQSNLTVVGNEAGDKGGGMCIVGVATHTNVTVVGNKADRAAGAFTSCCRVKVTDSNIAYNGSGFMNSDEESTVNATNV